MVWLRFSFIESHLIANGLRFLFKKKDPKLDITFAGTGSSQFLSLYPLVQRKSKPPLRPPSIKLPPSNFKLVVIRVDLRS